MRLPLIGGDDDQRFDGQVVLVTGAGSGIGREMALLFAKLGAKVHCVDINAEAVEAVRGEIESAGGSATARTVDCSDPPAVEGLAEWVFEQGEGLDVLCNNAGIGHGGPIEETTLEEWQKVIGINLMGVIHGMHFFVPKLLDQGRPAHVINTASLAGLVAAAQMAPYCASKFGVVGLSESLDAELADRGIRVTALCPGIIYTPILTSATMHGGLESNRQRIIDFYRTRGVTPDVVAKDAVAAVRSRRVIQPSPRSHVLPPWLMKRMSPGLSQMVSRRFVKILER
jgi:NAD(P)-dependent dehydrogenase (short-subunit alcohol dehydrogenase family)